MGRFQRSRNSMGMNGEVAKTARATLNTSSKPYGCPMGWSGNFATSLDNILSWSFGWKPYQKAESRSSSVMRRFSVRGLLKTMNCR